MRCGCTSAFCLSFRDVEELLLEHGVVVTSEAIRKWCRKFGQAYANQLRRRRPRPGDKWHLDEVFLTIKGEHHYFVASRRSRRERAGYLGVEAAGQAGGEEVLPQAAQGIDLRAARDRDRQTEELRSRQARVPSGGEHRQHRYLNNRAENSHQPTRQWSAACNGASPRGTRNGFSPPLALSPTISVRVGIGEPRLPIGKRYGHDSKSGRRYDSSPGCLKE